MEARVQQDSLRGASARLSRVSQLQQAEERQPPLGRVLCGGGSELPPGVVLGQPALPRWQSCSDRVTPGGREDRRGAQAAETRRSPLQLLEATLRTVSSPLAL